MSTSFHGVGVGNGRAIGPVLSMPEPIAEPDDQLRDATVDAQDAEGRLTAAAETVADDLRRRADDASGDAKSILEATGMMATDPMLRKAAKKLIDSGKTADRALFEAAAEVTDMLARLGGKMAERQRDVRDVRDRVIAELTGVQAPGIPHSDAPFVLLADDLAPADTATLDPQKVLALVTSEGGPQSHTAIIARALGLPAVVAARGVLDIPDHTEVHVDGGTGAVTTGITDNVRAEVAAFQARRAAIAQFPGKGQLADGTAVPLLANVGNVQQAAGAVQARAEGVGLFRTEFLFLGRDAEPSRQEQVAAYREVFDAFSTVAGRSSRGDVAGSSDDATTAAESGAGTIPGPLGDQRDRMKVVLRTLDAGADKPLPFLTDADEPNPALGVRGFRTAQPFGGVLARQLASIAEAVRDLTDVDVWVMAPMVSTASEAAEFRHLAHEAGLPALGVKIGVMIEVPAAALTAATLTEEVDFVSIGTNDLTQYTMAADRQLGSLAALNDPWQPAVLQLIGATGSGSAGPVGVCGEAAADPALAPVLVGLGADSLSMSPAALPQVAAALRTLTKEQTVELAELAMAAPTAEAARAAVKKHLPGLEELALS